MAAAAGFLTTKRPWKLAARQIVRVVQHTYLSYTAAVTAVVKCVLCAKGEKRLQRVANFCCGQILIIADTYQLWSSSIGDVLAAHKRKKSVVCESVWKCADFSAAGEEKSPTSRQTCGMSDILKKVEKKKIQTRRSRKREEFYGFVWKCSVLKEEKMDWCESFEETRAKMKFARLMADLTRERK